MKNGSNLGLFLLSSKNRSAFPGFKTFKNILIFCLTYLTYLLIVQTPEPPLAYNYHLCTLYIIYNFSMTSFNSLSYMSVARNYITLHSYIQYSKTWLKKNS